MERTGRSWPRELRHHGISLCLDFVFNHTSDEHEWARRALAGDAEYQDYYRMFPDRTLPDAYERTMVPVFPDEHPGSFTYRNRIRKWVWTTFHNYQWDLNYENPAVFNRMLEEMLFLANQGVEVLRLDAVAFVWKRLGTNCQNLPEAHTIIQAFNALVRIAAPAMVFKSEAIVHPDEVRKYIGEDECQLSYNPQLMALLWNSLATTRGAPAAGTACSGASPSRPAAPGSTTCAATTTSAWRSPTTTSSDLGIDPALAPALPDRVLHRPLPGQLRARPAVPGGPGHRRGAHLRDLRLAGGTGTGAGGRRRAARSNWRSSASCCSTASSSPSAASR